MIYLFIYLFQLVSSDDENPFTLGPSFVMVLHRILGNLCTAAFSPGYVHFHIFFPQFKKIMVHFIYYQFKDERFSLLLYLALKTNTYYLQIIYAGTIFQETKATCLQGR